MGVNIRLEFPLKSKCVLLTLSTVAPASQPEDAELGEGLAERLRILADARALKNLAVAFLHPERPVVVSDPTVFGRNYYGRPSAIEQKTDEDADEEVDILEDARALKMAAVAYLHPEIGISEVTPENFGRNYFNRPSAPETEEDEYADERAEILAEVTALKKLATDYMHPELGVTAVDGTCFGRNYLNRPSAPETEDVEVAAERACVLAEAAALKKLAVDFMHPELSITFTDGTCFGRNYFNRPSAPETEDEDLAIEETHILADAAALKKQAADYMHPEVGVQTIDSTVFGRNFFNQEASALEKLAAAVKGANLPSTKSSSSDNDLGITKKSASSVNLFGLSEDFV